MSDLDHEDSRAVAEGFLWQRLAEQLTQAGKGEHVPFLRHHVSARAERVTGDKPGLRTVRFEMRIRVADVAIVLGKSDGSVLAIRIGENRKGSSEKLAIEEARRIAEGIAAPPEDARPLAFGYEDIAGDRLFVARWERVHQGLLVEADGLSVMLNGTTGKLVSLARRWAPISFEPIER